MFLDEIEDEDLVPMIEDDEETEENEEISPEERAKFYKEYYDWVKTIYPRDDFEIEGKDNQKLYFYRGNPFKQEADASERLVYFLRDESFKQGEAERVARNLRGEVPEDAKAEQKIYDDTKAFIAIYLKDKVFNFSVDWDYMGKGYGTSIYNNYLQILQLLGIDNPEQYQLEVVGNAEHNFIMHMHNKELIAKTKAEPNIENATSILETFAKHPNNMMSLTQLNLIVEYAVESGVPLEEIGKAITENGFSFKISIGTREEDIEKFRSFQIPGLKATDMHQRFMKDSSFEFMRLVTDPDIDDTTLEFKRIFDELKQQTAKAKEDGKYVDSTIEKFGELEHIILDWKYAGIFFRNLTPEMKDIVKRQAIKHVDYFDPKHEYNWLNDDKTRRTFVVLRDAGLLDKEAYMDLYQKALNRNYTLSEFDYAISLFYDREDPIKQAKSEISQSIYCPCPKTSWQRSKNWGEEYRIKKVPVPMEVSERGKARDILKQEILRQGVARKTKIKTDMTGIDKNGKPFVVDNLKDWFFGVPGAYGHLQLQGNQTITLPPQTPEIAVELVQKALSDLAYPDRIK